MPRRTYRRKSYRRRRGYRRTKFSKFNLYRKSGAKSQAMQIYSLNKKVNRIYRNVRQDIDTYSSVQFGSDILGFTPSSSGSTHVSSAAILGSNTFNLLKVDVGTQTVEPDSLLVKDMTIYVNMRFNGIADTTQPLYMRMVIVKLTMNKEATLAYSQIFGEDSQAIGIVRGPLHKGVKDSGYKIIRDYKWIMTQQRPTIDKKIKLKGCRFEKGELLYPKNSIFIVYAVYNPNYSNAVNNTEGSIYYKLAYTNVSLPKSKQNAIYP